jgi:hypothetical protein
MKFHSPDASALSNRIHVAASRHMNPFSLAAAIKCHPARMPFTLATIPHKRAIIRQTLLREGAFYKESGKMTDPTITIPLDEASAVAYHTASAEDQRKIQLLFRVLLREYTTPSNLSLRELMDDIGAQAEKRGLTPAILEQLLNDDE